MMFNPKVTTLAALSIFAVLVTTLFQNCGRISASEDSILMVQEGLSILPGPPVLPPPTVAAMATDFYRNIKPLLESRCLHCHSAGNVAASISFETSDRVAEKASLIKSAVIAREMPPFDVSQDENCNSPSFAKDPRLAQSQIDLISNWVDQKVSADGKLINPDESSLALMKPSLQGLVVDGVSVFAALMRQSFMVTPPAGGVDQHRCFVIDSATATDKYLTAYQVFPGNPEIVNRVVLYQPMTAADADAAQALDNGSGYDCQQINGEPLVIWAPGVGLQELPMQTGIKVIGGRKMVLKIHYNIAKQTIVKADRSKVLLRLAGKVQWPSDWLAVAASGSPIPPGQPAYAVTGQMAMPSGYSGFYGVFPHMHGIGKKIRIENSTSGQCYSLIPNWRIEWHLNYLYNSMIPVTAGEQLQVKCTYDSTSRTTGTAFGESSGDEMCIGYIYAVRTIVY